MLRNQDGRELTRVLNWRILSLVARLRIVGRRTPAHIRVDGEGGPGRGIRKQDLRQARNILERAGIVTSWGQYRI